MNTELLRIDNIHPQVHPQYINEIKKSIQERGLEFPIVVIKTTKEVWTKEKQDKYPFILDAPDIEGEFYQIRFGHNRVAAYKELGMEEIPAIVCDTVNEAALIGKAQAKWMKQTLFPM